MESRLGQQLYQYQTFAVRRLGPKRARSLTGVHYMIPQRAQISPALRLFRPDANPDGNPESPERPNSLPEFYREVIQPHSEAKPSTRGEHELAIHRWTQFSAWLIQKGIRTTNPELSEIDTALVADFLDWMVTEAHENRVGTVARASPGSANKSLVYVRSFLSIACEHGLASPLGRTKRKRTQPGDHRIEIPPEHIDLLMHSCAVAEWPTRWMRSTADGRSAHYGQPFDPALFWRCQIVWLFTFGQRRGDIVALKTDNRPLCWANVIDQQENPHPNGSAINPTGWLAFTQSKTDKDLVLPIPAIARAWLDLVAATVPDRQPSDVMLAIGRSHKTFYATWRAIAMAAGVRPKAAMKMVGGLPVMSDRVYQLKNFRSTAASAIERHAKVGRLVTGHASDHDRAPGSAVDSGVFDAHYLTSELAVLHALTTLPLPTSFTALLPQRAP